ncbi:MAG: hypothetical protein FRX48_05824 [Lasallia pustulata]|uniref:Essential protein Yae1 N-terminal domain-containing protein n=1 Tax=Lasallia pustulata TaxID=136370 RepID=A0A5M8PN55_9LECA|nr:MAG: hypothetical protein FRX48_05824 [Lasallia pustulata]
MEDDPFDDLLGLEDKFYDEGYKLGVADGTQAGHVEGRLFGLEKGFERYRSMGKLHGRATVWASRLSHPQELEEQEASSTTRVWEKGSNDYSPVPDPSDDAQLGGDRGDRGFPGPERAGDSLLPVLPANPRIEKHIQTLYALVEPESLSTLNNEEAVSDFDDRLKRAQGKVKIIEKYIHEGSFDTTNRGSTVKHIAEPTSSTDGNGSIEDITSLHARH